MEQRELLQQINLRHGTQFQLVRRYQMGEQGAFAISDGDLGGFVLKYSLEEAHLERFETAAFITTQLRSVNYPAPRYLFTGSLPGCAYSVQEALPGANPRALNVSLARHAVALNQLQYANAMQPDASWPEFICATILHGEEGYCVIDSLRSYSAATAELLERSQNLVRARRDANYRINDIVHYDFSPANLLAFHNRISGVIDWDGVRAGDASFDLATLLFYAYKHRNEAVHKYLWKEVEDRCDLRPFAVYLAHMMIRQVDWSIRYYDAATVTTWLNLSRRLWTAMSSHHLV